MAKVPFTVKGLHHAAWRCRDAEETRAFYEDLLGLPLAHVIKADHVPSTGEYCPYVHIFFELADGSFVAFFDLGDDEASVPSPNTPAWVQHISFEVPSEAELLAAKARLQEAGVEVLGVTDHHFIQSIYFFDPNGIRLELSWKCDAPGEIDRFRSAAHGHLDVWAKEKKRRRSQAAE